MSNIEIDIENKIIYIGDIKFCELYKLKDAIVNIDEYSIRSKEKEFYIPPNPWQPNPSFPPNNPWCEPLPWIDPTIYPGPTYSGPTYVDLKDQLTYTNDYLNELFDINKFEPQNDKNNDLNINENHD